MIQEKNGIITESLSGVIFDDEDCCCPGTGTGTHVIETKTCPACPGGVARYRRVTISGIVSDTSIVPPGTYEVFNGTFILEYDATFSSPGTGVCVWSLTRGASAPNIFLTFDTIGDPLAWPANTWILSTERDAGDYLNWISEGTGDTGTGGNGTCRQSHINFNFNTNTTPNPTAFVTSWPEHISNTGDEV